MEQLKIVETDYDQKGAASMADNPITAGMGAADIKERFDSLVRELVAVRFNALIDLLMSDVPLHSGADQIHAPTIENVTGNTVAEQLASINSQLKDCVDAAIPDGAVTDIKLSNNTLDIKARFAAHAASLLPHIGIAGTASGTTNGGVITFTTTLSGFDPESVNFFLFTAPQDCTANAKLTIGSTTAQIVTIDNSNVTEGQIKANGAYLMVYDAAMPRFILLNPAKYVHTHTAADIGNWDAALNTKLAAYFTGAISGITTTNLTPNFALASNTSGKVALSTVTATELGYVHGVTSAIQTQFNTLSTNKFDASHIKYGSTQPNMVAGDIWLKPIT